MTDRTGPLSALCSALSPGAWVLIVMALASSAAVLGMPAPRTGNLEMWTFARVHAEMYAPIIERANAQRPERTVRMVQFSLPVLERRMLSAFLSGTPAADLIEVERGLVGRAFLGPPDLIGFQDLTELVERSGCIVVHCDFSAIGVDGVTLQAPGLPPTIFLNRDQPADRMRFTLAHELGHIIMHKVPSPTMDDEADAFASAFLMPAGDVRPYLTGGLGLARLASLKPIWRVSMAALLYRAKAIGAISSNQSSYLWRQLSAQGYRRREPVELEFARELPTSLPEIIRVHMEDLGYDLGDLSRLLHVETDEISRFQPIKVSAVGQTLRVIK